MSRRNKERAVVARAQAHTRARARGVRRRVAIGGLVAALASGGFWLASAAPAPAGEITVYKSPSCGCCKEWVAHARRAGFRVTEENVASVAPIKAQHGVPDRLASCHTSVVGGYVFEGHVPLDLVERLLDERPAVVGLAVPGMPAGSPGMEGAGKELYDVLTFTSDGGTALYARR